MVGFGVGAPVCAAWRLGLLFRVLRPDLLSRRQCPDTPPGTPRRRSFRGQKGSGRACGGRLPSARRRRPPWCHGLLWCAV